MSAPKPETTNPSQLEGGANAPSGGGDIAVGVLFAVLCTIFVALRFIFIATQRRSYGVEDWILIPAWLLMIGLCVNVILHVTEGSMPHGPVVAQVEPEAFKRAAQVLYATEVIYGILIPMEKTSILLLFLRLFAVRRWFRVATYILIVYVWAWGISETLVATFQCTPVALLWDQTLKGTCINQIAFYRWISAPNVIHDVAMLILPVPIVWKLQVNVRQKIALSLVFLLGSLGCVASAFRMSLFFDRNPAKLDNTLQAWTVAEPGVIMICACLPALWPLVVKIFPGMAGHLGSGGSGGRTSGQRGLKATAISLWNSGRQHSQASHVAPTGSFGRQQQHQSDDSVPLKDVKSHSAGEYEVHVFRAEAVSRISDQDIHVTRDIQWRTTPSEA